MWNNIKLYLLALNIITSANHVLADKNNKIESGNDYNNIIYLNKPFDIDKHFYLFDKYWNNEFNSASSFRTKYITEDKQYVIIMEVPGYDKEHIKIKTNGNKLFVSGNIEDQKDNKAPNHLNKNFNYSILLKEDIDQKTISSSLKNGILTITLPRIEIKEENAKVIPIN
ncbi:MAG: Hsp20/alpha crystallin family protein [Candidatus Rickettsia vulgarisii]